MARVLHALGHDTLVTGLRRRRHRPGRSAPTSPRPGIRQAFVEPCRRRPGVRSPSCPKRRIGDRLFNEPGPRCPSEDWAAFAGRFHELAARAAVVVLSGSLPPGPARRRVRAADRRDRDAGDPGHLRHRRCSRAPPRARAWSSPNAERARRVTGARRPARGRRAGCVPAARARSSSRSAPTACSRSPATACWRAARAGIRYRQPHRRGRRRAWPRSPRAAAGTPWPDLLADAVALSAAAVARPLAGDVDLTTYRRLRRRRRGGTRCSPRPQRSSAPREAGRGVGAFNVIQLEHAEALVAGAEAAGAPGRAADQRERGALPRRAGALAVATLAVARARGRRSRCTSTTRPPPRSCARPCGSASAR